ncbi:MBL fold metallo-hydrolase [Pseudooceanicola sp. CBS1P-1]|uniref:MBL fold metallo-hydrolase n=1 Tax=Pseudooceanicola albus TaxID=2692189 RepID=A0A6L7G1J8_9RHOB|nr:MULTISPECIES: MBL fold metallo-hydrolase [Pseudooceanicola]MBT9383504.1 MBL fold metallo-hydrolase [Pseudooceanicola endophyticus]MXN17360.1 MBL fold metallo-hydrolase [Pseudooceanicola albus]
MAEVQVLSGVGDKGPACLRVTHPGGCWLLDCGHGPEESAPFRTEWLEGVDAVFISHDHVDHIGGAVHVIAAGLPIYTTAITARALPPGARVSEIPVQGRMRIGGVTLTTGRNGHALGGVWMHFDLGRGLFYSGDWSEESHWFAFDEPPAARTALIDASYHLDPVPQTRRKADLDALLAGLPGQVLLPVPPSGRAGELALHLMGQGSLGLDDTCRDVLAAALGAGPSAGISEAAHALAPLLEHPFDPEARFLLCDTPNAEAGAARALLERAQRAGRLGRDFHVVFTGHMTAHARALAAHPGVHFTRWNVHPPLGDQLALVDRLGVERFVPLFCPLPEDYLVEDRTPARLFFHERVSL